MNDFTNLEHSMEHMLAYKDGSAELHLSNIALMRGGQLILEALQENGSPKLRLALQNFAQNGGGLDVIAQAIRSLFPDGGGDALTDAQIGELADYLVANYKP
jgi:hypothetical protein